MKASPEQQQALLTLADTDEELRRLEHKRANLDEQKALDTHVETQGSVAVDLMEAGQTQERLSAQSSRHEREIDTVDTSRRASEHKIYSGMVTDEKSLAALRAEIDAMHNRKNDLEETLLEIMEQADEVGSLVEELTNRKDELKAQIADLTTRRNSASEEIDAALESIGERRAQEAEALGQDVLGAYDRLRDQRKGRVVARLEGKMCTGCHMDLTAIELEEIKATAATELAYCQQCGSIVVVS